MSVQLQNSINFVYLSFALLRYTGHCMLSTCQLIKVRDMWGPIKSQIEPVQIFIVGDVKIILLKRKSKACSFSSLKIAIAFCTVFTDSTDY